MVNQATGIRAIVEWSRRIAMLHVLLWSAWFAFASISSAQTANKLSDEALLTETQRSTFEYFWSGAEEHSGWARERIHLDQPEVDATLVTSGGTGFGLMAILVGIERKFVERDAAVERLEKILDFAERADRFHGIWPHWLHGDTGKVKPFSPDDDGADLVESSFFAQGLICVRQYFAKGSPREQRLAQRADKLWREMEWDFFRGPDRGKRTAVALVAARGLEDELSHSRLQRMLDHVCAGRLLADAWCSARGVSRRMGREGIHQAAAHASRRDDRLATSRRTALVRTAVLVALFISWPRPARAFRPLCRLLGTWKIACSHGPCTLCQESGWIQRVQRRLLGPDRQLLDQFL